MTTPEPAASRAELLLGVGRADDAVRVLTDHLATHPDDVAALSQLARAHLVAKRPQDALTAADLALAANPEHAAALQRRCEALRRLDRVEEAVVAGRACVARAPHSWVSHYALGLAQRKLPGHRHDALVSARKAVELAPHAADPHVLLGLVHADSGDPHTAATCYQRALAIDPDHAYARSNLSLLDLRRGRFTAARRGFEAAAAADPQETLFHRNIAATVLNALVKRGYLVAVAVVFTMWAVVGPTFGRSVDSTAPAAHWPVRIGLAVAIAVAWAVLVTVKLRPLNRYLRGHLRRVLLLSFRSAPFAALVTGCVISQGFVLDALLNPTLTGADVSGVAGLAFVTLALGNVSSFLVGRIQRSRVR